MSSIYIYCYYNLLHASKNSTQNPNIWGSYSLGYILGIYIYILYLCTRVRYMCDLAATTTLLGSQRSQIVISQRIYTRLDRIIYAIVISQRRYMIAARAQNDLAATTIWLWIAAKAQNCALAATTRVRGPMCPFVAPMQFVQFRVPYRRSAGAGLPTHSRSSTCEHSSPQVSPSSMST